MRWCYYILDMRKYTSQMRYNTTGLHVQKLSLVFKTKDKRTTENLVGRRGKNGECYFVDERNNI